MTIAMTVHMLRFVCDKNVGSTFIDAWLPQYLTNLQAWEDGEPNEPPVLTKQEQPDDTVLEYYYANWRFAWTEDPSIISDQIAGYAGPYSNWFRLKYHICYHDEADRDPCEWDDALTQEAGPVPEGIL